MVANTDLGSRAARHSEQRSTSLVQRLGIARGALAACTLCERRCGANRSANQPGFCQCSSRTTCIKRYLSCAEDPDLVPALRVYLAGCNFRCRFCNTAPSAFDATSAQTIDPAAMAAQLQVALAGGARSIDMLGGEPSLHPHFLLALAAAADRPLPLVLDTNLYMTPQVLDLLDGVVRVYLANLKFGNDRCALLLAGVERYTEVVTRNLQILDGRADLRIRYLLVPGHVECCLRPMVAWLSSHLPGHGFHLMTGYVPCWQASADAAIGRLNSPAEIRAARQCLAASNLDWRIDGDGPG
jgi:putative pyruvate formate lyase activating enzyme